MKQAMFCQLTLTCANKTEADKVAGTLLVKHLVACVRQIPVKSKFHWQGKIENADEVMLVMESHLDLFEKVEAEVAKLHSYETFVLTAQPIEKISAKAAKWMSDELNG